MILSTIFQNLLAFIKFLYGELRLFYQTPKDYLYLYTYPTDKKVKIEPYDPHVTATGEFISGKINKLFPGVKVHFIGSPVLGIDGQKGQVYPHVM